EFDMRAFGREIDFGPHAVDAIQHLLDPRGAGSAGHSGKLQIDGDSLHHAQLDPKVSDCKARAGLDRRTPARTGRRYRSAAKNRSTEPIAASMSALETSRCVHQRCFAVP